MQRMERAAGRRVRPRWAARPLDIDIICRGGRIVGHRVARRSARAAKTPEKQCLQRQSGVPANRPTTAGTVRGKVQLPHPEMHKRAFVLGPMAEVAPHWRHPMTGRTVRDMLRQLDVRRPRR